MSITTKENLIRRIEARYREHIAKGSRSIHSCNNAPLSSNGASIMNDVYFHLRDQGGHAEEAFLIFLELYSAEILIRDKKRVLKAANENK